MQESCRIPADSAQAYHGALLDAADGGDATAQREVANTALHEAAHVMGKGHPNGYTLNPAGYDVYSDPYFNLLSPGANTCIRY